MQIDITPCFSSDELDMAVRLITARAARLGIEPGALLTTQLREIAMDEAGVRRYDLITEEATAAAEARSAEAVASREAQAP